MTLADALRRWHLEPDARRLYAIAQVAGLEVRVQRLHLGNPYTDPCCGKLEDVTALYVERRLAELQRAGVPRTSIVVKKL